MLLATGSVDHIVRLWDLKTSTVVFSSDMLKGNCHTAPVVTLAWIKDDMLISGSKVWAGAKDRDRCRDKDKKDNRVDRK